MCCLPLLGYVVLMTGCDKYDIEEKTDPQGNALKPAPCPYGTVQSFASLDALQLEHKTLYDAYMAAAEDEVVLENYEIAHGNFYSLRKKDYEITEGIIPDEANFDPFDYTSDSVLETILNKDGMVIIGTDLYLWSDGTVIHKLPYSCSNYLIMMNYRDRLRFTPTQSLAIQNLKNNYGIQDIVIGMDPRYDLASISEYGTRIDNRRDYPAITQKNACGLETILNHKITGYDLINDKIRVKLTASTAELAGTTPINSFIISNASAYQAVTVISSSTPFYPPTGSTTSWPGTYVGEWVEVEIDFSNYATLAEVPAISTTLTSLINGVSSNSCSDTDAVSINIQCPLSMTKKILDYSSGLYEFSIEGLQWLNVTGYTIKWSFGDGTITTTSTAVTTHQYSIPCFSQDFTPTAYIEKPLNLCANSFSTSQITLGNPCVIARNVEKEKYTIGNKKARIKIKIKPRAQLFGGGSKLINKFRCRIEGTKAINSNGTVLKEVGLNCVPTQINTILPYVSQSGKKKLKQKYSSNDRYGIDANAPYSVTFTHTTDNFSQTLTHVVSCMQ